MGVVSKNSQSHHTLFSQLRWTRQLLGIQCFSGLEAVSSSFFRIWQQNLAFSMVSSFVIGKSIVLVGSSKGEKKKLDGKSNWVKDGRTLRSHCYPNLVIRPSEILP